MNIIKMYIVLTVLLLLSFYTNSYSQKDAHTKYSYSQIQNYIQSSYNINSTLKIVCPSDIHEQVMYPQTAFWGAIEVIPPTVKTSCILGGLKIELLNTDLQYGLRSPPVPYVSAGQETTIFYKISDNCGYEFICSYSIKSEIILPHLSFTYCPNDVYVTIPQGARTAVVDFPLPIVEQKNCNADVSVFLDSNSPPSGSEFQVGRTTINYIAQNKCTSAQCSFDIIVEKEEAPDTPSSTNCLELENNYNLIGSYQDHYYYHSKDIVEANTAYTLAKDLGGYLVVIDNEFENDFIKDHLVGTTYIGLSDKRLEGNLEWSNNIPYDYSNFEICDICEDNSVINDYVVIHQWDGKWSFTNKWSKRYFIIEFESDPCSNDLDNLDSPQLRFADEVEIESSTVKNLYPNPTQEMLHIDLSIHQQSEVSFQIFDTRGALIINENISLEKGEQSISKNINHLQTGMYYIKIQNEQGLVHSQKIVKI